MADIPLGISSFTYRYAVQGGHLDPWRLVERCLQQGLQVLQFLDNMPLGAWPDADLRTLGRTAAAGGLTLQMGMSGLDPAQMARCLEMATLTGAREVRATVVGDVEVAYRTLHGLLPALRDQGLTVALENHFGQRSAVLAGLVRRLGDPHVAICLDTLNSVALLEGPGETVAALAPYAVSVHLKDGVTRRAGTGFIVQGTALGEGLLDLPALLRTVWATGRRPPMLIELWQDAAGDEPATLAAEEAWIARSLDVARRLAATADKG